jgi:alkylated DNA repair dioxygenase AlkB
LNPEGFEYFPDVLTGEEERELLDRFSALPFAPYVMRGYEAKRRIVRYDATPEFVRAVRDRVTRLAGLQPATFAHTLITEYPAGAQNGWHRDMPQFGPVVLGVSLASACRMRFRKIGAEHERATFVLEPRSADVMGGASRSAWQHSVAPVEGLRYSITFRSVKPGRTLRDAY